jgi:hypothetical protein
VNASPSTSARWPTAASRRNAVASHAIGADFPAVTSQRPSRENAIALVWPVVSSDVIIWCVLTSHAWIAGASPPVTSTSPPGEIAAP